ncbi:unnamed protein product [Phytophthora lilii]|uniref:Unnamed protein product n=1 Tax=Phytophthora lilii TaxID=2077276 RepID=A0A9W6TVE7_9STRA|nr:unnamed protein product [Phytophthora lilii]
MKKLQGGKRGPRTSSLDSTVITRETEIIVVHSKTKRYAYVSLSATWWGLAVLTGAHNPTEILRVFPSSLIQGYLGEGMIRDSPLVEEVLGGDTTPRDFVLFLESETQTSTKSCSMVPLFNPDIYNYEFLSNGFQDIINQTEYHISVLAEMELVVIVVDCTFKQIILGDPSVARFFYVVRSRAKLTDMYVVTMSLNVQQYEVRNIKKRGPALVGMLTMVQDMQAEQVDQFYMISTTYPYQRSLNFEMYELVGITDESYLELRSIPREPSSEPVKQLITARKRGFYNGDSQANVRVMYSILEGLNAKTALTRWEWIGEAVTIDSWAWVHCIHLFFGMQTVYSLIVLVLVTYQKICSGKVWIGDPFASLSTASLVLRGVLVVISWCLDSFWSVNEYAMSRAAMITGSQVVRVHKEVMHADIMVVFLALVGFLSSIFRERIDPAIAIFLFEFVHTYRLALMRSSSAVLNEVETYSEAQWKVGIAKVTPTIASMSPMRLWSSFEFPSKDPTFLFASFFPTMYMLVVISFLAIIRKIYHYRCPEQTRQRSSQSSDTSGNEKSAMMSRGIFTNFELATGAELETRYGLISDYNNYVFFKGMKFASADGVYCSGYVIVNGKFLVATKHLLSIIIMKATGSRFTNVYAYEVEGNTVKDTARLVHTSTFLWSDLWHLSVTFLSNGYKGLVENTKYNITTLKNLELVVIVVNCTFRQLKVGDPSAVRVYNFVRSFDDPNDVQLITVSLSVQDYEVRGHAKKGPAVVGMLTIIHDMQDRDIQQFYMVAPTYPYQRSPDFEMYEYVGISDESFLELRSIPRDPLTHPVKNLIAARKRGFFNGDSQSNVRVMYSTLESANATTALTRWEWIGEAVTIDSWAWVHWGHLYFGLQTIYSLIVLFFVTYHKLRAGKIWIGDPFASVSTTSLVIRGMVVFISWYIDSFWSINSTRCHELR